MSVFKQYNAKTPYINEIFEYMDENGKSAIPCTQDVKNLTGQHTTLEQFIKHHIKAW
jgi:hypothetical protein